MTTEQLQILVETIQQLSRARDLDSITRVVRSAARRLTGADGATFVLKDNDLCFYADEDAIAPLWKGQRFPMSACISGWSMINKECAVIEDIYADSRIPVEAYSPTFVKSLVMVPIRKTDPIGAIGNYWAARHQPGAEEIYLLQSLADITSVSIENVYVYNELEQRVRQRTEQLEAVNKELEAFSYSVSHDLRAPLRAIKGFTEMFIEDFGNTLNEDGRHLMNNVSYNASKMEKLVDDLLSFSRLGKKELRTTEVNMNDLTEAALNELKNTLRHNAKVEMPSLHTVSADYGLMYQVMINLVGNAIKYSSKKADPHILIHSARQGEEVVFSVTDNGAGFDMKYAQRLFGVFQRLHTDAEFEGTGVGLALVQRIINKHGGRVWADAKPGKGATFSFALKQAR
jgi:signal transduction histidine kinase